MSARHRRQIRRFTGDQSGFSLVELLLGSALALVVAFAALNFSEIAARSQDRTADRAEALGQARVALERMTREVRQATAVNEVTSTAVDVDVYSLTPGDARDEARVRYDCSQAGECRRYEYPVGATTPTDEEVVVGNVAAATFTPSPQGDYLRAEILVEVPDHAPVSLTTGVHLPNLEES